MYDNPTKASCYVMNFEAPMGLGLDLKHTREKYSPVGQYLHFRMEGHHNTRCIG